MLIPVIETSWFGTVFPGPVILYGDPYRCRTGFSKLAIPSCVENLETSGILTDVSEMSGILLKVREKILSGKSGIKLFIVGCICASILDFAELVHFILVSDHALLHSFGRVNHLGTEPGTQVDSSFCG